MIRQRIFSIGPNRRWLVDVDGVVADLMGGFEVFFLERHGVVLQHWNSDKHSISKSEFHRELHGRFGLDQQVVDYLSIPDVYQRYIRPIRGAQRSIARMVALGDDVRFVTAIMDKAPSSFASKREWLEEHFPGVPMVTADSHTKHWVVGDWAIDDRYDTCKRWSTAGTPSLLFRQPWNEAPEGVHSYDWEQIDSVIG